MSSLVDRLEQIILSKKLTFNRVERDCGFGNGTIKRWSTQSPRLDKLVVVSQYLDVSLDYLVFGSLRTENISGDDILKQDNTAFSQMEIELVKKLRRLEKHDQEIIFEFVTTLSEKVNVINGSDCSIHTA